MAKGLIRTDRDAEGIQDEEYCLVPSSSFRGQHLKFWAKNCNELVSLTSRLCQQHGETQWAVKTNHLVRSHCFFSPNPSTTPAAERSDPEGGGFKGH